MGIKKYLDEFLENFYLSDSLDDYQVKKLLDQVCEELHLKMIYITEVDSLDGSFRYIFVSGDEESLLGHKEYEITQSLSSLINHFDEDCLIRKRSIYGKELVSPIILNNRFLGKIAFVKDNNSSYSLEERKSLISLSNIFKYYFSVRFYNKFNITNSQIIISNYKMMSDIIGSFSCGIIRCRKSDNKIIYVNQKALDLLGYQSEKELLLDFKDGISNTVPFEEKQEMLRKMSMLHYNGDTIETNYSSVHKDGTIKYLVGNLKLIIEDNGEKIYQRLILDRSDNIRNNLVNKKILDKLLIDIDDIYLVDINQDYFELIKETNHHLHKSGTYSQGNLLFFNEDILEENLRDKINKCSLTNVRKALTNDDYYFYDYKNKEGLNKRIHFHIIDKDDKNLPRLFIFYVCDLNKVISQKTSPISSSSSIINLISQNFLRVIKLDVVTLATYLIKIDNSQIQEIYNGNFNDILNNLVTYIHPDDFIKMSKSHSLKKMISDDNVSSFIYRSKFFNAENDYQWIKTTIKSYQEGETKYKLLISELVEEEQNVKQEIEFNDIVYRHLSDDYVVYLVSKYHHDDIITYRNDEYFKIKNANKSFKDSIKKFIDKYLIDEDKVYLYENFNDFSIKNDLVNTSCFSLTIRLKNNYEMIYGQLEIKLFIHDNQTYVVFGIKNIDHLIKNIELSQIKLQNELLQSQLENKEKNDFFSNMSHDIRTSMNAIKGFSTLAIGSTDSNTTNDYLRKVIFSTDYLLNQFNNVLDISKMQSHKMVLNEKKENLANIFHEFKIVITPDILLKNLHFKMDVVNVKFDEVYCDKLRINQILFNLVSNAIKYTPEGGHIELILTQIDNNLIGYGTYQIMVKDDGIGISQEYIDHIFEPYVRENSDIVKGIHGTGLGMAITKNIVDMMKGNIKIESTLQKGSTFLVTFNLRYVENQNDLEILSLKQDANALIICSNAIDGENVASLFSLIGIKGEYAIDDEKIIELLESHNESNPYDFVIFDRSCTNINIIHQVKKNHQTYVFYLKNEFEKENVIDEQYVDIYLEKPLFISDIKNALNNRNQTILEDIKKDDNINLPLFNKRILLVEDYDLNKEMATLMLEKLGAIVECADNGEMAYNLVKSSYKGYYSLILMDIQMPVMDGYLATKMIRNLPEHDLSSIIIIGMSANSSSEDITNAKLSGMNDYLLKPIDMGNLLNTLKKYL